MSSHDDVEITPLRAAAESFLGNVEERYEQGGVEYMGIPTGLHKIDYLTGGLQPDCMWVIGARTGVGKSSIALDIALHAAGNDYGVLFYSQEMRAEALAKRLISRVAGISSARIERGKLSEREMRDVRRAADRFENLKLGIIDRTLTSDALREHALGTRERFQVDLLVVDHAQALADSAAMGETEKVGQISNKMRQLARPDQMNCPVILLAQLNRGSEHRDDPTPKLSDLRNSGNLEQDAEVALLLHRPYLYERMKGADAKDVEAAQIIIAKNRDGSSGSTAAKFYPSQTRWEQGAPDEVRPRNVGE